MRWTLPVSIREINLHTGGHIASDLCGNRCEHGGKQRIHTVYEDDGWIWVDVVDIPHPPRASDVYNQPTRGGRDGQGYGLDDGPSGSSIITVMDDVGNSPALGGSWGLTPYAGVERRPLPPSPVKMQVQRQPTGQDQLNFRGRKLAAGMRRQLATKAVAANPIMPPMAGSADKMTKRPAQRTLDELFGRQKAACAIPDGGPVDMES
eukprot:jgi/Astpho2/3094/Aster-x1116